MGGSWNQLACSTEFTENGVIKSKCKSQNNFWQGNYVFFGYIITCFRIVVLENTLESLGQEIKPVNPKGNKSWIFLGRTDAEAETPKLWPPDAKNWLIGKDPDAGKDWRQEEKTMTEDEIVGWHYWLNGQKFEQTPGDSKGQGSLVRWSPGSCKESDITERLNNNNNMSFYLSLHGIMKWGNKWEWVYRQITPSPIRLTIWKNTVSSIIINNWLNLID